MNKPSTNPEHYYDLGVIRAEWAEAIEHPFDASAMQALQECYRVALRRKANWEKLYDKARAEHRQERDEYIRMIESELKDLTKEQLYVRTGLRADRYTKRQMIDHIVNIRLNEIENEHQRVKRVWAAMTEDERNA